jgi:hypothetical protein
MKYKTVFWDFNGVVSHDFFYRPLQKTHPKAWDFVQSHIFGPLGNDVITKWMRADIDLKFINDYIIKQTGVDQPTLEDSLIKGGAQFAIDSRHFDLIDRLKSSGIKVGLVTDNMDVFDLYINPHYQFETLFDVVVNSFPFKMLKSEGLFDVAMKLIGTNDYDSALLIEDSPSSIGHFKSLGGNGYHYRNFEDFKIWADTNLNP